MFCKQCGNKLAEDAQFCSKCGWAVPATAVQAEAIPTVKKCASCGTTLKDEALFCPSCGKAVSSINNEPVIPTCSNCGKKLEDGERFCSHCGNAVGVLPNTHVTAAPSAVPVVPVTNTHGAVQTQPAMADEKYCFSCGAVIKKAAEICPKCGVNQNSRSSTTAVDVYCSSCGKLIKKDAQTCPFCGVMQEVTSSKNKTTALVLLLFTAVGHRFYTGKIGTAIIMGLAYLLGVIFCAVSAEVWEFAIPGLILVLGWIVWWIIDLVYICTGKFLDNQGKALKKS